MWNNVLPAIGETYYDFALWFIVYSVMGWVVESAYMTYCNKKLTNRGFIHGPICPIYGFGGILVHTVLKNFAGNWVALFFLGMMLATTVEYVTAVVMIKLFGCVWWDYSNKPFNYKGILCLESCVAWGLYTIIEFAFLKDIVFMGISSIPFSIGKLVIRFTILYYFVDFTLSIIKNYKDGNGTEEDNILQFKY